MEKVLIASFDREEEQDFEELVLFLKEKGYRDFTGMASADNVLKYNDLKINPKYRMVRNQGEELNSQIMSLTSSICWQKDRGRYFPKSRYIVKSGKNPIMVRRTM